jgi:hypothetical protein
MNPPNSGLAGKVKVLLPTVTTSWVLPATALERLIVQFNSVPAEEPVQLAGKLLAPWVKLTLVVQLEALELHGKLTPVRVNDKLLSVPLDKLPSPGVSTPTLGKLELVVSISSTSCK